MLLCVAFIELRRLPVAALWLALRLWRCDGWRCGVVKRALPLSIVIAKVTDCKPGAENIKIVCPDCGKTRYNESNTTE